MEKVVTLDEM